MLEAEKDRQCGTRMGDDGRIQVKIGNDVYGFAVCDALTLANQIKKLVRQATGLTNPRRKKQTLKEKRRHLVA